MAERTFDYSSVSEVYQQMLNITEEISDLLDKTNTSYHDVVNVSEEAIYGDLGKQLLLDWDNTASSFPNFVSNFENWTAVIAASGGDYSEFEEAVKGFQDEHSFGSASDTSMTDAYTNTGDYSNSYTSDELDDLASLATYYELTGATYIDTGMVSALKSNDIWEGVTLALDVATIGVSAFKIANWAKNAHTLLVEGGEAAKSLRDAASTTKGLEDAAKKASKAGLFNVNRVGKSTSAAAKVASNFDSFVSNNKLLSSLNNNALGNKLLTGVRAIASGSTKAATYVSYSLANYGTNTYGGAVNAALKTAKVGTPLLNKLTTAAVYVNTAHQVSSAFKDKIFGTQVNVGNSTYSYFGETDSGQGVYVDSDNNLVYKDSSGNMQYVTYNDSSNSVVTIDTLNDESNDNFSMNIGNSSIDSIADLNVYFQETDDSSEYFDNISTNMDNLSAKEA